MDLTLDRLACRRGGRLVFRDLDFHLPAGSAAALRGPNGVGKSTLLRLIAGFLPPAAGDVRLGSHSRAADPGALQERIAYAGHLDAVKPALSVRENLSLWAGLHGAPPARVTAALERFGLAPIADRRAAECSAGQKRRLGLSRLLVMDRPLWLLDEPTVSLDRAAAALVAELVAAHVAGGGLALVATHIDLGLETATLTMDPASPPDASAREGAGDDPFLEGRW